MVDDAEKIKCQDDVKSQHDHKQRIPEIVERIVETYDRDNCFDHVDTEHIPSKDAIIDIVEGIRRILFPGYFVQELLDRVNLRYYIGQEMTSLFEQLSYQTALCIRHECKRHELPCTHCTTQGREEALKFMRELPSLRILLAKDVRAAFDGDPAAKSHDEIIFCYPGIQAATVYRIAHQLHIQGIPLMPRIMSEYAHGLTGIDIHPGARIGESFFIDHGVGVVIGETSDIGNRVRIYQGVTLGALSLPKEAVPQLRGKKRHPTIEDDVIIYSGVTILGGDTVIGSRSVIGGNVWLTKSIPPDTRVFMKEPELLVRNDSGM